MSANLTEHYLYNRIFLCFFSTKNHIALAQNKIDHRISKKLTIASLKSLIKVPTQKAKLKSNLYS